MPVQPGSLVRILSRADSPDDPDCLYEVVNVEADDQRCWVRRWPQPRRTCAAFPVSICQLDGPLQREAS